MSASDLFQGSLVRLTALTAEDLPTLVRWYQDAEFLRLFDSRPAYPKTEPELKDWLEELRKDKDTFAFGIRLLESDDLIGYLEVDGIDWQHGACGMGLGIGDQDDWGKGYGLEATQLGLGYAFNELNLHRVTITIFDYNERSMALAKKAGFQREGVSRERLQRDGARRDMLWYGLLRHEWEAESKGIQ